jgi:hypothetical protein
VSRTGPGPYPTGSSGAISLATPGHYPTGSSGPPGRDEPEPLIALAEETIANCCCDAKGCESPPDFGFMWPGQDKPNRQCLNHTILAVRVADALGFKLVTWKLPSAD